MKRNVIRMLSPLFILALVLPMVMVGLVVTKPAEAG